MDLNLPVDKQSAAYLQNQLKSARTTLLVAVVFTVLNVVLLLIGSGRYFLYSATVPYYLTFFGYMFDHFTLGSYTLTGVTMAAVPVAALALCFFMSKRDSRWLTGAVVVFALDTAAMVALMVWSQDLSSSLLDIIFHAWVLISLVQGIKAAGRLQVMEARAAAVPQEPESEEEPTGIEEIPEQAEELSVE